jgi:hypothetical protein
MDLKELFFRHQIGLAREDRSDDHHSRRTFGLRADHLAARIAVLQQRFGALATPLTWAGRA